jgi:hypothetical protein
MIARQLNGRLPSGEKKIDIDTGFLSSYKKDENQASASVNGTDKADAAKPTNAQKPPENADGTDKADAAKPADTDAADA